MAAALSMASEATDNDDVLFSSFVNRVYDINEKRSEMLKQELSEETRFFLEMLFEAFPDTALRVIFIIARIYIDRLDNESFLKTLDLDNLDV